MIACFYGGTGVILGAFGAHFLKEKLSLEQLDSFKTGVYYQFFHALLLLFIGVQTEKSAGIWLTSSGYLIIVGIAFFSGSIYLLSTKDILGIQSWKWLGPITPLGGSLMILSWFSLIIYFAKSK
ncbi:MAG: hypothetical protein COA79_02135 [Planctomycetota bacterium]|nr:MAG: hypothetical protein COA79_02135 [Planctomycetota bacterium]